MNRFLQVLRYDPIQPLLGCDSAAVIYFAHRDLQKLDAGPIDAIWRLPEIAKILKKQKPEGYFTPPKAKSSFGVKYELIETWRQLRVLVDQYQMDKSCETVDKAAEDVFSCQSDEGDFRGILCNQYAPYYTGALLYLLIKAGYADDERVEKGMQWLLSMRQNDGGWLIGSPGMAHCTWKKVLALTSTWTDAPKRDFDKSLPFSAAGTGMAIRALAVHPVYRKSEEAKKAALLLCGKFFREDNYSWYKHPDNWVRFQFPYWWNTLVSALDMVSLIGLGMEEEPIENAVAWLIDHQQQDGLWKLSYSGIHKSESKTTDGRLWISLCICRVLERILG